MSSYLPVLIILGLGGSSGLFLRRWISSLFWRSLAAGGITLAVWLGICCFYLLEFGQNAYFNEIHRPLLFIYLASMTAAAAICWLIPRQLPHNQ